MITQLKQLSRTAMLVIPLALLTLAGGCGSSGGGSTSSTSASSATTSAPSLAPVKGAYSPAIDPANFVTTIDNRYFPLQPGTAFHYKGLAEDGKTPQTDNEVVTDQTKMILGVRCTAVRDTVSSHGHPIERTFDFYAEDSSGNVWYMGEDARDLHNGRFVKAKDSWQSGVNGAQPGIIMPGSPQQGDAYRQEYYPGHAMDQSRVIGSGRHVTVPAGSYKNALFTEETAPSVDPGVAERKWNVAGIGVVREKVVSGNHERLWLVSVTHHSPSTSAQAANPAPLNGGSYSAQIRPADFVSKVDNPYLPFTPGTRFRYQGVMKNGTTPQTDTRTGRATFGTWARRPRS